MRFTGFDLYKVKCDTCDFEDENDSISMHIHRKEFPYEDGDKCPDCEEGKLKVTEEYVSSGEHKQRYYDQIEPEED